MSYLTIFDIAIISIVALSTILGAYKGFVNIIINFIGFIISIIGSVFLYKYIFADLLMDYIHNEAIRNVVAGFVSYLISLIFCSYIFTKISNFFEKSSKGVIDRVFGFWLGLFRGIFFILIIFWAIIIFTSGKYLKSQNVNDLLSDLGDEKHPVWIQDSYTKKYLDSISKNLLKLFPEDTLKSIKLPRLSDHDSDDAKESGEDIIDSINKKKGDVISSVSKPFSKDVDSDL